MPDLLRARQQHDALVTELRVAFPEADDRTIADTAAGESDLDTAIAAVLRDAIEADETAKALAAIMRQQGERKRRLEARADRLRAIALQAAEDAGMKTIRGPHIPDFSASILQGRGSVVLTDETLLPDQYIEIKRYPKKGEIGDALRAGEEVPGAVLSNPHSYWMVRRS